MSRGVAKSVERSAAGGFLQRFVFPFGVAVVVAGCAPSRQLNHFDPLDSAASPAQEESLDVTAHLSAGPSAISGSYAIARPIPAPISPDEVIMLGFVPLRGLGSATSELCERGAAQFATCAGLATSDKGLQLPAPFGDSGLLERVRRKSGNLDDADNALIQAPQLLLINRKAGTIAVIEDGRVVQSVRGEGVENLKAGKFQLLHKQRNALWYAPDSYFSLRNLPLPPAGHRERFRRGALGEFVLFVDESTPLHSGPLASSEIGGVRISETDLARIYYSVAPGIPVQVR